jgi:transposase-like protein
MGSYANNACYAGISANIASLLIEGCGIRSIARLLTISAVTVLKQIKKIAGAVKKPMPENLFLA